MSEADTYDGIVLGSGHNGLVLQAYMCRAGLKVLCLERRDVAGGGLATMEDPRHPGFLHNTHSFFHRAIDQMPWYHDLELRRHGAQYIEPKLNFAMVLEDGRSIQWWDDFEKTHETVAQFNRSDADRLRYWREAFVPIVQKILLPESRHPPLPPDRRRALLEKSAEGRFLLEVAALSPLEFVLREFRDPVVRGAMLFINGLREVDLRCPGFGHHIAALLAAPGRAQMCVGGSAQLARALESDIREHGGSVMLRAEPRRILVEAGRAVGVQMADGQIFRARQFIASNLNPQQTFLDLMDERHVPGEWRDKAAGFEFNLLGPLFSLNLNLTERPRYRAAEYDPRLDEAFLLILGLKNAGQFDDIVRHHEAGSIPPTVMWGASPTQFDPSQAPPGKHTAFMWEKLPYKLGGDARKWDQVKQVHGREMLEVWKRYAPNIESAMIDSFTRSPLDTERTLPNLRFGDTLGGGFMKGQVGFNRPFPGAGAYRAHLPGLYLCGSCCHPGGNITGLAGYNAAQVISADLRLEASWAPPPLESV